MAVSGTNFESTLSLTDSVNSLTDLEVSSAVRSIGTSQGALYTLLSSVVTKINALNAKLDLDGGVNDTNYATLYNVSLGNITQNGLCTEDLGTLLVSLETNMNAILTKLDADTGVADADYNSTLAVDLDNTVSANGVDQDKTVSFLESVVDNLNALLTKLDADAA